MSRRLQLLDENAQELRGGEWVVDNPELAEISEDAGQIVLHPKKIGTVTVSAMRNGGIRHQEVVIWSPVRHMPDGTTNWGTEPIGREINDLPAVPGDGPHIYSLEQNTKGTFLRAFAEDGIQLWIWRLPEETKDVELVCGDWLGGALISANKKDNFTLYAVSKDGTLRWRRTLAGTRKGHAISQDHLVHILTLAPNGLIASLFGFDETTGTQKFNLAVPASTEKMLNLRKVGDSYQCTAVPSTKRTAVAVSRLFISIDGNAYLAFSNRSKILSTQKCIPGTVVAAKDVSWKQRDRVVLWQIRPEGMVRSSVVEESKWSSSDSEGVKIPMPTGGIIPDGNDGILLSVRWAGASDTSSSDTEEFVYRISPGGEVVYKFPLPSFANNSHDDMVLGSEGTGFATRGGKLIVFDVQLGKEMWSWDSNTPEIAVYYAARGGGCVVQTAEGLVWVEDGQLKKKLVEGTAFRDWEGKMFKTHQKPFSGNHTTE